MLAPKDEIADASALGSLCYQTETVILHQKGHSKKDTPN